MFKKKPSLYHCMIGTSACLIDLIFLILMIIALQTNVRNPYVLISRGQKIL